MSQKRAVLALKVLVWVSALAPGTWIVLGLREGWLGANPVEKMTHVTGMTTLILLLVTLAVSPVRKLSGWNPIIRLRRPIGLFAFFYATVHFTIWFAFYNVFNLQYMVEDIGERPYITVGFTAWLILLPLAATSTKGWIRRLGRRWTKVHMGIYAAAALGVVHFYWLVKADTRLPVLLGVILAVLLLFRTPRVAKALRSGRSSGRGRRAGRPAPRSEAPDEAAASTSG